MIGAIVILFALFALGVPIAVALGAAPLMAIADAGGTKNSKTEECASSTAVRIKDAIAP
jgi:hypothetical protein